MEDTSGFSGKNKKKYRSETELSDVCIGRRVQQSERKRCQMCVGTMYFYTCNIAERMDVVASVLSGLSAYERNNCRWLVEKDVTRHTSVHPGLRRDGQR